MHLKRIVLKGFKSFPDRTPLAFEPGVSVIIGPNGSGKSNVTDAVLWAMGEQSPLAVRGGSMQDVIFGGGPGRQAARAAEVELVLDNSDGSLALDFAEVSVLRRLERGGEGEYRLNGARCRLADVLELLADTGLGKESHSVISQGRVESIVNSRPRERRLLIEEAAGLGKHRGRRRRAQLKLERTQSNLDRALDVEREARARLRPLKRQAEAAELHARLQRQLDEARWELSRDAVRDARALLAAAERGAASALAAHAQAEADLAEVGARRQAAEESLTARSQRREALAARVFAATAARQRLADREERARALLAELEERANSERAEMAATELFEERERDPAAAARVASLEAERARLDGDAGVERERELAALEARRGAAAAIWAELDRAVADRRAVLRAAEQAAEHARGVRDRAERSAAQARREAARVGGELAAANQFLRVHAGAVGGAPGLADELDVEAGCELALAAVLGGLLRAALAEDRAQAGALLDRAPRDGGSALVLGAGAGAGAGEVHAAGAGPPCPGARPLTALVRGPAAVLGALAPLLADAWLVERLDTIEERFAGVAVTRGGRVWNGRLGELGQVPAGGAERVLAERNRREALLRETEVAASAEHAAARAIARAEDELTTYSAAREQAQSALRAIVLERDEAAEGERRAALALSRRRDAPDEGPRALRRAQIDAEMAAERRLAEHVARERSERARRRALARARAEHAALLVPRAEAIADALAAAAAAVAEREREFRAALAADRAEGDTAAAALRACAQEEAGVLERLRRASVEVTSAEVAAQRARDRAGELEQELVMLAATLELAPRPAEDALTDEARGALGERIERLVRRREQLGPVNPLAAGEYADAVEYVEELESRRDDMERAIRDLGVLVRDIDRQISDTFEQTFRAAEANFAEVVEQLFPGGRGRLRLVHEDERPRAVLGGAPAAPDADPSAEGERGPDRDGRPDPDEALGVEIELTPSGKAMKRLSLLSGGEKSLTALAFLFAVFLARPCPFYILDEVEAALDDVNIGRVLELLRRYAGRAQFIVVTHQRRTMEVADSLYGVSMGADGVSKVVSRRLGSPAAEARGAA